MSDLTGIGKRERDSLQSHSGKASKLPRTNYPFEILLESLPHVVPLESIDASYELLNSGSQGGHIISDIISPLENAGSRWKKYPRKKQVIPLKIEQQEPSIVVNSIAVECFNIYQGILAHNFKRNVRDCTNPTEIIQTVRFADDGEIVSHRMLSGATAIICSDEEARKIEFLLVRKYPGYTFKTVHVNSLLSSPEKECRVVSEDIVFLVVDGSNVTDSWKDLDVIMRVMEYAARGGIHSTEENVADSLPDFSGCMKLPSYVRWDTLIIVSRLLRVFGDSLMLHKAASKIVILCNEDLESFSERGKCLYSDVMWFSEAGMTRNNFVDLGLALNRIRGFIRASYWVSVCEYEPMDIPGVVCSTVELPLSPSEKELLDFSNKLPEPDLGQVYEHFENFSPECYLAQEQRFELALSELCGIIESGNDVLGDVSDIRSNRNQIQTIEDVVSCDLEFLREEIIRGDVISIPNVGTYTRGKGRYNCLRTSSGKEYQVYSHPHRGSDEYMPPILMIHPGHLGCLVMNTCEATYRHVMFSAGLLEAGMAKLWETGIHSVRVAKLAGYLAVHPFFGSEILVLLLRRLDQLSELVHKQAGTKVPHCETFGIFQDSFSQRQQSDTLTQPQTFDIANAENIDLLTDSVRKRICSESYLGSFAKLEVGSVEQHIADNCESCGVGRMSEMIFLKIYECALLNALSRNLNCLRSVFATQVKIPARNYIYRTDLNGVCCRKCERPLKNLTFSFSTCGHVICRPCMFEQNQHATKFVLCSECECNQAYLTSTPDPVLGYVARRLESVECCLSGLCEPDDSSRKFFEFTAAAPPHWMALVRLLHMFPDDYKFVVFSNQPVHGAGLLEKHFPSKQNMTFVTEGCPWNAIESYDKYKKRAMKLGITRGPSSLSSYSYAIRPAVRNQCCNPFSCHITPSNDRFTKFLHSRDRHRKIVWDCIEKREHVQSLETDVVVIFPDVTEEQSRFIKFCVHSRNADSHVTIIHLKYP